MSERLARLRLLLQDDGLDRLQNSTVMVIGLGGVGSAAAEALARGGVGSLVVLDRDTVEESNINRQALAFTRTLGMVKADVMREMIYEINPDCTVHAAQVYIDKNTVPETLGPFPRPDYVLDCIDTLSQKLAIAEWAAAEKLPLISSMGAANKLDPCLLKFSDIRRTSDCPMSRVIRRECRVRGIRNLEVLSTTETPFEVESEGRTKGETLGSMSYMPPIMGQMMAGKVIRRLAGMEGGTKTPKRYKPGHNT